MKQEARLAKKYIHIYLWRMYGDSIQDSGDSGGIPSLDEYS
jgi:hypothetical protein